MTLLLSANDVVDLLPMDVCIDLMAETQIEFSRGEAIMPVRTTMVIPAEEAEMNLMPAWMGGRDAFGCKLITFFPGNLDKGIPAVIGLVALLDAATGELLAVLDGTSITGIRTAAASAAATRALAHTDASTLAVIGAGAQAASHLAAMLAVRPVKQVRVAALTMDEADAFAARARGAHPGITVEPVADAREALAGADLVCTVTYSSQPVVDADWLEPGCHINAVGSHTPDAREIDGESMRRARVVVDSRDANLAECGDCLIPIAEGLFGPEHVSDEIGEVLAGTKPGRTSPDQMTIYQSCGLAVQDMAAARCVYDRARAVQRGVEFEF
jgi:alanine dehydrogenase